MLNGGDSDAEVDSSSIDDDTILHEPIIRGTSSMGHHQSPAFRFKITIPEPFKMTLREEMKQVLSGRRSQRSSEAEEGSIDAECLRQFRAKPVPANTFLPLYEKLTKDKETKRREAREQHKVKVMPFAFVERDANNGRRRRSMSVPNLSDCLEGGQENLVRMGAAAPPSPSSKKQSKKALVEMMEEKELMRECRIKSRAEKLLKMSSLPQSMAQRQEQMQKTTKLNRHSQEATKPASVSRPQSLPRFERTPLQKRPATSSSSSSEKIYSSVQRPTSLNRVAKKVKEDRIESRSCRRRSKTISEFDDLESNEVFPPPKMTLAAMLRESANRKRTQCEKEFEEKTNRTVFRKQKEELKLKQMVVSKSRNFHLQRNTEEKKRNFRDEDKKRLHEYHLEIKKMTDRLKSRPLLMEQQSQLGAVRKVDKRFREKLRQEGLDEDLLLKYSQRAAGSQSSSYSSGKEEEDEDGASSGVVDASIERNDDDSSDTSGNEEEEDSQEEEYSTFEETSEKTLQGEELID